MIYLQWIPAIAVWVLTTPLLLGLILFAYGAATGHAVFVWLGALLMVLDIVLSITWRPTWAADFFDWLFIR